MDIDDLRAQIDETDSRIVGLFKERMRICAEIAAYKAENGLPVCAADREKQVLDSVCKQAGAEYADGVRELFLLLMELSRSYQRKLLSEKTDSGTPV